MSNSDQLEFYGEPVKPGLFSNSLYVWGGVGGQEEKKTKIKSINANITLTIP